MTKHPKAIKLPTSDPHARPALVPLFGAAVLLACVAIIILLEDAVCVFMPGGVLLAAPPVVMVTMPPLEASSLVTVELAASDSFAIAEVTDRVRVAEEALPEAPCIVEDSLSIAEEVEALTPMVGEDIRVGEELTAGAVATEGIEPTRDLVNAKEAVVEIDTRAAEAECSADTGIGATGLSSGLVLVTESSVSREPWDSGCSDGADNGGDATAG